MKRRWRSKTRVNTSGGVW
jgi:hypothetical protein